MKVVRKITYVSDSKEVMVKQLTRSLSCGRYPNLLSEITIEDIEYPDDPDIIHALKTGSGWWSETRGE